MFDDLIPVFKAFSHPLREKILRVLLKNSSLTSFEIADRIGVAEPVTKYHLGVLIKAGLVNRRSELNNVDLKYIWRYSLDIDETIRILEDTISQISSLKDEVERVKTISALNK